MSEPFDDVVSDALTTVKLVPRWTLPEDNWLGVADALKSLDAAISAGASKDVRRAAAHLDSLYPPTRLAAIPRSSGKAKQGPPPPEVMELVNTLIHPEGGWGGASGTGASDR